MLSHTAIFYDYLFWFGFVLAKGRESHATLQNRCLKAPWVEQQQVICHTIKKAFNFLLSGTVLLCPHLKSFYFYFFCHLPTLASTPGRWDKCWGVKPITYRIFVPLPITRDVAQACGGTHEAFCSQTTAKGTLNYCTSSLIVIFNEISYSGNGLVKSVFSFQSKW